MTKSSGETTRKMPTPTDARPAALDRAQEPPVWAVLREFGVKIKTGRDPELGRWHRGHTKAEDRMANEIIALRQDLASARERIAQLEGEIAQERASRHCVEDSLAVAEEKLARIDPERLEQIANRIDASANGPMSQQLRAEFRNHANDLRALAARTPQPPVGPARTAEIMQRYEDAERTPAPTRRNVLTREQADAIEAEMRALQADPATTVEQMRLFMQSPMPCRHAVGNLLTCDAPPFGCVICGEPTPAPEDA